MKEQHMKIIKLYYYEVACSVVPRVDCSDDSFFATISTRDVEVYDGIRECVVFSDGQSFCQ